MYDRALAHTLANHPSWGGPWPGGTLAVCTAPAPGEDPLPPDTWTSTQSARVVAEGDCRSTPWGPAGFGWWVGLDDDATVGVLAGLCRKLYADPRMRARWSPSRRRWEVHHGDSHDVGEQVSHAAEEGEAWAQAWLARASVAAVAPSEAPF